MKAVLCDTYGPPEVLRIQDVPTPTPKDNEVLVAVKAAAVNSGDVRVRGLIVGGFLRLVMRVVLGFTKPRNPILGVTGSGVIEKIGKNVTRFKPGDEVFFSTGFGFGTYAEYVAIRESGALVHKPKNASFQEAAAIVFGGMTAIYFLEKAGIQSSEPKKVLIYGATGAVGSSAVQIAKHYKANVTAVCGPQGVDLCKHLGSDQVLIYTQDDMGSHKQEFDIVFDAVGKLDKSNVRLLLKQGGVYVTVGGLDTAKETIHQLEILRELYEDGELLPVIDKVYDLDDIVEAHRYVETGKKQGNVVVSIATTTQ